MTRVQVRCLMTAATFGLGMIAAGACHDNSLGPTVPASVTAVSGDAQTVLVGNRASAPLVAVVKNSDGAPLPNVTVSWAVKSGGGSLNSVSGTTDANGEAQTTYLSGVTAGTSKVSVKAGGQIATFTLTLAADTVAILSAFGGNGAAALIGNPLTLTAKATDRFGNAIKDVVVDWSASGGALKTATATTDSTGQAANQITVGPDPGDYTVTAASRFNTVTFTVTAIASP
jgi:hypothetical protein